jgi:hypothetical protein
MLGPLSTDASSDSLSLFSPAERTQRPRQQPFDPKVVARRTSTPVSDLFFSPQNVDILQDGIRYRVFVDSGGRDVIGRQSDVELGLVMRSLFLQEADNDTSRDETSQVRDLNASVLSFCVPRIVQEINQYRHYRKDVAALPVPLPRGEIATTKGSRSLEWGGQ